MAGKKVNFINDDGFQLSGTIDFPSGGDVYNYAIFSHCFSCNKNFNAVRNISNALTSEGFAVLQFDFTGLGGSEGDFSNTNFSGNVEDLLVAAEFLEKNYEPASLIVGHSLGGAAALFAAAKVASIKAVGTIASPSDIRHVKLLFKNSLDEIRQSGFAEVNLGGRTFTIKKQFLDDIEKTSLVEVVKSLKKPLLIMHSPADTIVSIDNAGNLYKAAHHPKNFICLDGADHMLMQKEDSLFAGKIIAIWAGRYLLK